MQLVDDATKAKLSVSTNHAGLYSIPDVMPGVYELTVTASGFASEVRKDVTVNVGAKISLDFSLHVGSQSEQSRLTAAGKRSTPRMRV